METASNQILLPVVTLALFHPVIVWPPFIFGSASSSLSVLLSVIGDECVDVCERDAASAFTNPPRLLRLQILGSNE